MTETAVVDVTSTDSSPVAVVDATVATSDLTPQERQEWRKSGEKPSRTARSTSDASSSTPPADSSPDALADPAAETSALNPPASEPGTSARKKQNAETRKPQLDADIQERLDRRRQLDQEISDREARLRSNAPAQESTPASSVQAGQDFPEFEEWLAQPGNETKGLGAYTKAAIVFDREQTRQQEAIQHEKGTKIEQYRARIGEVEREDPKWSSKVAPEILALSAIDQLLPGTPVEMPNVVAQEILESSAPYQVQRYLTDHPDEFRSLLHARTPAEVIRKVSAISARLSLPASPPLPMVKTTTDAPDPPPQIGNRTQSPNPDELLSAAISGDQRRYKETANAIDIARMRAGGRR